MWGGVGGAGWGGVGWGGVGVYPQPLGHVNCETFACVCVCVCVASCCPHLHVPRTNYFQLLVSCPDSAQAGAGRKLVVVFVV